MSESTNPKKRAEEIRIGVYTCYCGGNISDVVDCEHVSKVMGDMPNVVISRTDMSMCSDAGQALIEKDIAGKGINRVIVGACAPSLHEQTFRGTVARAGLNPYLYHHVGLREQDSWVSKCDCDGATCKALNLMAAGIAKTRLLEPLEPIRLAAEQHALVIGGGVAGLRTALDTARRGIRVTLIEKSPFLGGRMAQLSKIFPTDEDACTTLETLIQKVVSHPKITIFTQAEVTGVSGYVGDYQIKIQEQSRGIREDIAEAVLDANMPKVPDAFNYGLTERKVIYKAYPGCYPPTPAVDWENYDGEPIVINGQPTTFYNEPKNFDLKVGAIVVATGFTPYEPRLGEYGYKELPEVVTLPQLIRHLALDKTTPTLTWAGRAVNDIALIHCVGSRELEGVHKPQADGQVNNYCSRVCCTATLHMANELRERFPDTNIYDFYEDIRTYGRGHETYYQEALEGMVRFLRFHGNERPEVVAAPAGDTHPVLVRAKDHLTWGEELEVPVDLVVLAVGMLPTQIDDLVKMLKVSRSVDRFLAEVHPKLKPVETAVNGVILAGTAQGPMTIQESVAAASAAAVKVSVLLGQGEVQLDPFVAYVDPSKCDGTGDCIEVCKYEDAITMETVNVNGKDVRRAVVTPANCAGCGGCVSACPNRAIDIQGWTLDQYDAMVDAIALDLWELMEVPA
ncbi:MAG: CoB--CoM heterodisulfide reductase iron-sulfur subunit A family protein [Chloroflexi bacterium]|jgi:heterodisulfide reductase subunit A2|nr:CoB--CoM heterodisulfide reductase iron-sulfur subunit A family protein [Chloroflexota bacterium]